MHLSAYVRCKQTKEYTNIARDTYTSKDTFAADLRCNGYAVVRISNNRDIAAQDAGFVTFAAMQKHYQIYYSWSDSYADKMARLAEIAALPL